MSRLKIAAMPARNGTAHAATPRLRAQRQGTAAHEVPVFCSLQAVGLMARKLRPTHRRLADRMCAHMPPCMPAYGVGWHQHEAWSELTFTGTDRAAKATGHPVVEQLLLGEPT